MKDFPQVQFTLLASSHVIWTKLLSKAQLPRTVDGFMRSQEKNSWLTKSLQHHDQTTVLYICPYPDICIDICTYIPHSRTPYKFSYRCWHFPDLLFKLSSFHYDDKENQNVSQPRIRSDKLQDHQQREDHVVSESLTSEVPYLAFQSAVMSERMSDTVRWLCLHVSHS